MAHSLTCSLTFTGVLLTLSLAALAQTRPAPADSLAAPAAPAAPADAPEAAEASATIVPGAAVCGQPLPAELCVDFDASRSVDAGAGSLTYRWTMGDGDTLTGLRVSHCYARRGRYQVVLDVLVPGTDDVRRLQRTFDVDLLSRPVLNFSVNGTGAAAPLTVRVGQPVVLDALDSVLPACQQVVVIWDFRDGRIEQGRRVTHVFRKPGRFAVRMALRGYGPGSCAASNCVSQEIVVE